MAKTTQVMKSWLIGQSLRPCLPSLTFGSHIVLTPISCRGAHSSAKPVIPKRGDKDFEPAAGGSNLQAYSLERSRQAMTDALRGTRNISS